MHFSKVILALRKMNVCNKSVVGMRLMYVRLCLLSGSIDYI